MRATLKPSSDLPELVFERSEDWADWLDDNHDSSFGLWLRLAKKGSGIQSVSYQEAVEAALCYGWIDGQKKSHDASTWLQEFTPRGKKSIWSKINREKAEELIRSGKMKPAGLAAVESAKQDGRWDSAYDSQSNATVPEDIKAELDKNPTAMSFFATLNSVSRYASLFRIQDAKRPEIRRKRIEQFVGMLERNEKVHP